MSDDHDDDAQGDGPDTFEDRLAGVVRLIDTFDDDPDEDHRRLRRAIIERLLAGLLDELRLRIDETAAQLDRAAAL